MKSYILADGGRIPAFGLGTWKSARGQAQAAVQEALRLGYRHVDCAPIYDNEAEVGKALGECLSQGVAQRQELWITSKLWNSDHDPERVRPALEKTLSDLRLASLDLYLIHWPVLFKPGLSFARGAADYLAPEAIPVIETWKAMEDCVRAGLTRYIGVSNFSLRKLDALCSAAKVPPLTNQVESHPYLQQQELLNYCAANKILLTAYAPLGSGDRPKAMKKEGESGLLDNPFITAIAAKHQTSPGQVLIAWGLQRQTVVIPKSVRPERLRQNLEATQLQLDQEDMERIASLESGYRFVDGSFFCSPGSPYSLDWLWRD